MGRYGRSVVDGVEQRSYGRVFDEVAEEYDRHRPAYPDELVDRACELAGLTPGEHVLEVGCGTGQLTRSLVARGLRVTAVEPGANLRALAEQNLGDRVEIIGARLEDADLAGGSFTAAFSASAFHWVDPDVSWQLVANALAPGGCFSLIQYFGLKDPRAAAEDEAMLATIHGIAPELEADWPEYRSLEETIAGGLERRHNVSALWAWLGSRDLARDYVPALFEPAELAAVPILQEHPAGELNALLQTMSFWAKLSPEQRQALEQANNALQEQLARPIRVSILACLVSARRSSR
jgi:SAM-dependent methyltransferase